MIWNVKTYQYDIFIKIAFQIKISNFSLGKIMGIQR